VEIYTIEVLTQEANTSQLTSSIQAFDGAPVWTH
jgi:hypothetical protein